MRDGSSKISKGGEREGNFLKEGKRNFWDEYDRRSHDSQKEKAVTGTPWRSDQENCERMPFTTGGSWIGPSTRYVNLSVWCLTCPSVVWGLKRRSCPSVGISVEPTILVWWWLSGHSNNGCYLWLWEKVKRR
jgi:hypothetical protein